ncbi:MAG: hypothetical protein C4309_10760 [Chloroflexota bacterium]
MVGEQDAADISLDVSQAGLIVGAGDQGKVAAPRVDQICGRQVQATQEVAGHRLGEQLQVEGAAPQSAGGSPRRDRVDEVLHAADVAAHQQG